MQNGVRAAQSGYQATVLEGDNQVIINALNGETQVP